MEATITTKTVARATRVELARKRRAEVLELRRAGEKVADIAAAMGCCKALVSQMASLAQREESEL